jgi:recombination protein RecT
MANTPARNNQGNNQIALKSDPRQMAFKGILESPGFQTALRAALPRHLRPEKIIRVVLAAMQNNPKILECEPNSVVLSIMRAASMGLEPDGGPLGHGYLVPFWNGKARRLDCQFIPGYRGLCKLARNSGEVADVWAEVVYEADQFDYELGLEQKLVHKRNDDAEDPGELQYAYAVARFRDGEKKFVVMNRREVLRIKQMTSSKTKEGKIIGPWADHEPEQWKKTAIRRLAKYLPLSPEAATYVMAEDDAPITIPAMSLPQIEAPKTRTGEWTELSPEAAESIKDELEDQDEPEAPSNKPHIGPGEKKPRKAKETAPDGAEIPDLEEEERNPRGQEMFAGEGGDQP